MNLKSRVDNAEAEVNARLEAEREAAVKPVLEILGQASDAESAAFWRWALKAGKVTATKEEAVILCDGQTEPQPGDDELIAAIDARIPPDVGERLKATYEVMT
jgi:regulator of protease activity HflC (stomatin/prohibitin superfamily)